jgi:uncharacterized membrane protein YqaE (UPF0057 family)
MKKLFTPFILFTITSILMSSCSGPSTLALTKRHYRAGYYVDWAGKKPSSTTNTDRVPKNIEPKIASLVIKNLENTVNTTSIVLIPEKLNQPQKSIAARHINIIANKTATPTAVNQNENTLNISGINTTTAVADVRIDANISFVVIVICAIFLPPLGVALMYGIHLYFWVDLVLTLLFFFPGMIFALIVVCMQA